MGSLLIGTLLACSNTAPPSDHIVSTVTVLETALARQAIQVTIMYEQLSYVSTRVAALPTPPLTAGRPTFTPAPSYPPTPTDTPVPTEFFPSPHGSRQAFIRDRGSLMIQEADGQQRELLVTDEISSLAWFPDGEYIAYSEHDLSQDIIARRDHLWIVNVETGEHQQIGTGYYAPHISPDGNAIAVLAGVLWGDACLVGYDVAILALDDAMRVVAVYHQNDFAGLPGAAREEEAIASFYPVSTEDIKAPGIWQNNSQLMVALRWACSMPDDQESGVYLLDLTTLQAKKIDDLNTE